MAWKSRSEEWSRPPEPSPAASGIVVQLLRAAAECEFELVPDPGQVMQKGLDLGSRTATKGGTHDAVIMNLTPKCPCEVGCFLRYQAVTEACRRTRGSRRMASSVTIENSPSRQGVVRAIALSDHWR